MERIKREALHEGVTEGGQEARQVRSQQTWQSGCRVTKTHFPPWLAPYYSVLLTPPPILTSPSHTFANPPAPPFFTGSSLLQCATPPMSPHLWLASPQDSLIWLSMHTILQQLAQSKHAGTASSCACADNNPTAHDELAQSNQCQQLFCLLRIGCLGWSAAMTH